MEICKYVVDADIRNLQWKAKPLYKCVVYRVGDKGVAYIYETDDYDCLGKYFWASYVFDAKNEAEPNKWTIVTSSGGYNYTGFVFDKDGNPLSINFQKNTLFWKKTGDNQMTMQCIMYNPLCWRIKNNKKIGPLRREFTSDRLLHTTSDLWTKTELYNKELYQQAQTLQQDVDLYYRNQIQKAPDWLNKIKQRKCPDLWLIGRTQKQKG